MLLKSILIYFEKYLKLLDGKKYKKIRDEWKKHSFLGNFVEVQTINKKYNFIKISPEYQVFNDYHLFISGNQRTGNIFI